MQTLLMLRGIEVILFDLHAGQLTNLAHTRLQHHPCNIHMMGLQRVSFP